jgi:hypothetical protein
MDRNPEILTIGYARRVAVAGLDEIGGASHMRPSLLERPLSTGVLITILNVLLVVHAARAGRFMPWGLVILFLPGIGGLLYIAFELLPQWFGSYGAQRARRTFASALDPRGRYRALKDALDVVDTIANRSALADECLAIGRPQEALDQYEAVLARPLGDEPAYRIGKARALLDLGRAGDAVEALEEVKRTSPDLHSPEGRLLYARALEMAGRSEEALDRYASLAPTYPGPEPSVRRAQLLEGLGQREQARSIADEVVRSLRRAPAHVRANEREWFALANRLAR